VILSALLFSAMTAFAGELSVWTKMLPLAVSDRAAQTVAQMPPATASRLAKIGQAPDIRLVDSAGRRFDLSKLRGKIILVSFVYTTCNGSCPATTQTLVRVERALMEAKLWKNSVEFVSITLDPARDTPEVLDRYARLFGADLAAWHYLTGDPVQVGSVIKAWGMWVKSVPSGALDHPSRIFLIDRKGREREIYNLEFLSPAGVLEDVRELLREEFSVQTPNH
jgi:protein SCO1/2